MEYTLVKNAGFCFGVKRAIDKVYELLKTRGDKNIYTLGKLIHNKHITDELCSYGVKIISEEDIENVPKGSTVVTRAHGITKKLTKKLSLCDINVEDCTCPYVKKIHCIADENSNENSVTFIIGDPNHPEVQGIKSYVKGEVLVFNDSFNFDNYIFNNKNLYKNKKVIMVAQTTQKLTEWEKCQKIIKKVYTNTFIFDTICSVTENRQSETAMLAKNVDIMLVIGDRDSSNSNKLYDTAKEFQPHTFFIENSDSLPVNCFTPQIKVGITAGASTPSSIIEEVVKTMSQNANNNGKFDQAEIIQGESFADMLENSLKTLNTGETVKGIITSVSPNEIHVDLEAKVTGIIPLSELTDNPQTKIEDLYKVGDEIEAIVVKVSDLDGVATLSRRRIDNIINWRKIVDAAQDGSILEGKITEAVKSGVIISIKSIKVFVPASQSGLPKDADLATLVGTTHRVKIIDINEPRRRAVASIRMVQREERKAIKDNFWNSIEKEKKYTGIVKSLTSYGAFVDLGGVDGMVHSSELSWKRIKHPSEIVNVGDTIDVYVKDFDKEAKRISLGYKTEATDPWYVFNSKYQIGDIANVKIVSMMPFGAFAEVVPGTDGLIHISQITDHKINQPSDILELGQTVDAKITDIDMDNHKISLSIRAIIEDEKAKAIAEAEQVADNNQ